VAPTGAQARLARIGHWVICPNGIIAVGGIMDSGKPDRIDDPIEASYAAWPEDWDNRLGDVALASMSAIFEPAHLLHALKEMFSAKRRIDRISYLLTGFRLKARELDSRVGELEKEKDLKAKLDSPQFKEALFLAMEEASRTLSQKKIDRYASLLANSLIPEEKVESPIDLSTLIRDVSQLTDEDIRVLDILRSVYADVVAQQPNVHDPNAYTEKMGELRHAIVNSKLHPDDFQAICERLSGFGLAAEVLRNPGRMNLNDFCYRPTRRGVKLLKLLGERA
jgi:hypothetical protein